MPRKVKRKPPARNYLKPIVLAAIIVVAILGALLYYHYSNKPAKVDGTYASSEYSTTPAPAADNNANNNRKSSSNPPSTLDSGGAGSGTSGSATSGSGTSSASFSVQINPTVIDNGATIHVGTEVFGTTTGTCTLIASKSGMSSVQLGTAAVQQDVNNYDCGVFNASTSSLAGGGTWKLTLTVSNSSGAASGSANVTF